MVTGQVDFDSHMSRAVAVTVDAINVVTPGHARGRGYEPPAGRELADAVFAVLGPDASGVNREYRVTAADLAELSLLLGDLRAVFADVSAGDLDSACERTNRLLRQTSATPFLIHHNDEPWHLHFHAPEAGWAMSWASPMAVGVAVVLGGARHDRLGVCSAPACDRVYVDTSRNGTRRFCSTACQNRVKAAAFRDRQRD